jgi:hypothetical protein
MVRNFDMSLVKDVRISGRKTFQFRMDFLNAFNTVTSTANRASAPRRWPIGKSPGPTDRA